MLAQVSTGGKKDDADPKKRAQPGGHDRHVMPSKRSCKRVIAGLEASSRENTPELSTSLLRDAQDLLDESFGMDDQTRRENELEEAERKKREEEEISSIFKDGESKGPRFEVVDYSYRNKVLRTEFKLDSTWSVKRGTFQFTAKEGYSSQHESFIIVRKVKNPTALNKDSCLSLPIQCVPGFYVGMKKIMEAREEHLKNLVYSFRDSVDSFPVTAEGIHDLEHISHHGYPKYTVDLGFGYVFRVQEVSFQKGSYAACYDALCITRLAKAADKSDSGQNGSSGDKGKEKKKKNITFANSGQGVGKVESETDKLSVAVKDGFTHGVPVRLIPALYKCVEYVYYHEFLSQGKIDYPEIEPVKGGAPSYEDHDDDTRVISASDLLQREKINQMERVAKEAKVKAEKSKAAAVKMALKDANMRLARRKMSKVAMEVDEDARSDASEGNHEPEVDDPESSFDEEKFKESLGGCYTQRMPDFEEDDKYENSFIDDEAVEDNQPEGSISLDEEEMEEGEIAEEDERNGTDFPEEDRRVRKEWKKRAKEFIR